MGKSFIEDVDEATNHRNHPKFIKIYDAVIAYYDYEVERGALEDDPNPCSVRYVAYNGYDIKKNDLLIQKFIFRLSDYAKSGVEFNLTFKNGILYKVSSITFYFSPELKEIVRVKGVIE